MEYARKHILYSTLVRKILLTLFFALATGYAAQVRIPLPWTPVPITLQTFFVLLAGMTLGASWGGASQLLYVLCGALGVPFFSGLEGGLSVLCGARGGYLLGFILTAFVVGRISKARVSKGILLLKTLAAYTVFIYGLGCAQLALFLYYSTGVCPSLGAILSMGMLPFLIGDFLKIVGAVWLVPTARHPGE